LIAGRVSLTIIQDARVAPKELNVEELRQKLAPLTDWIPGELRERLPVEAWWGVLFGAALLVLVIFLMFLRRLFRGGRQPIRAPAPQDEAGEDLGQYPPLLRPLGANVATVYHVPARLRLAVVAPVGKMPIDPTTAEAMLDQVVPGLGQVARDDKPRVLVWPPQLSHHGFGAMFHRATRRPEAEGEASRWILVAGRAQVGKQPVALGLAFQADQPNTVGRLNIEPQQWLDVIRLRPT
jgi:hypothetical protein